MPRHNRPSPNGIKRNGASGKDPLAGARAPNLPSPNGTNTFNMEYIINGNEEPLIAPKDINTSQHFWNAFGHSETEVSANWIVRFCQYRNQGWLPFTVEELECFYQEKLGKKEKFWFNRLHTDYSQSLLRIENNVVHVSRSFVAKCYASSPTKHDQSS